MMGGISSFSIKLKVQVLLELLCSPTGRQCYTVVDVALVGLVCNSGKRDGEGRGGEGRGTST